MVESVLLKIKDKLIKGSIINENLIDKFIENIKEWEVGTIVYPGVLKEELNVEYPTIYKALDEIRDMGLLQYRFEIYCTCCDKVIGEKLLKSLNQFPEKLYCDKGHKLNPLDNAIVLYEMVKLQ
jgi:hypothetical protein